MALPPADRLSRQERALQTSSIEDIILYKGGQALSDTTPRFSNGMDIAGLGERIRLERQQRRLSLEALAAQSGVSRSMLSDIERGAKVPTVLVLDRIATGLGASIARLLGEERTSAVIVLRREEQDVAVDPSGWERRILSP